MRKIVLAATLAAAAIGGMIAAPTPAQAQYVQFGFGNQPPPRPYYDPYDQRPPGHYRRHRPRYGYYDAPPPPPPRCRFERRIVDGPWGPREKVYRICR